jgi:hypothetical protein
MIRDFFHRRPVVTGASGPVFAATFGVVIFGCGGNPAGPSPDRYRQPRVILYCQTSGESVVCTATLVDVPSFGEMRAVTQSAEWMVVPPDVGFFREPGVLMPRRLGEAEVHARSEGFDVSYPPRFLIGPGQAARQLHFFAPLVRERDNSTSISGALVEMLDGYRAGTTCTTTTGGTCTIDRVLTGETFTARISKEGYQPTTVSYRVDPPVGVAGNPPFPVIILSRVGE